MAPVEQPQGQRFDLEGFLGQIAAACEEAGITVRPFAGEGVRITVAETEANDRVISVAQEFRRRLG